MGRSFWYRGACSLITGSLLIGLYGCSATDNTVAVDTQEQEITQESLKPVTFTFYNAMGWRIPGRILLHKKLRS